MKRTDPPRGIPYTPAQARASATSLFAQAEQMLAGPGANRQTELSASNYLALAATLMDYADLREAEEAEAAKEEIGVEL